jgi:gluconolactonase
MIAKRADLRSAERTAFVLASVLVGCGLESHVLDAQVDISDDAPEIADPPSTEASSTSPSKPASAVDSGHSPTTNRGRPDAGPSAVAPPRVPATGASADADPGASPVDAGLSLGKPKLISKGLTLAESPVWDHCGQRFLLVDVEKRAIHAYVPGGAITKAFGPTNYANGMIYDSDGSLLLAEMGGGAGGRITRLLDGGVAEVLADKSPSGAKLQTSDDLTLRSDGTLYFTDPIISHGPYLGSLSALGVQSFYRLSPPGPDGQRTITKAGDALQPNGIRLSPDEQLLYVSAYLEGRIKRYRVAADGALTEDGALVTGLTNPDSMCLDAAGNVYIGTKQGLQVIRADGKRLGVITIPSADGTTNCAFGGPDGTTLLVTAWTSVYLVEGLPIPGLDYLQNQGLPCASTL